MTTLKPTFTWNAVPGATSYKIQVSTVNTFLSYLVNATAYGTTYTPTINLAAHKTLYWRYRLLVPTAQVPGH